MKYLAHAFLVAAVLVGGDFYANGGTETGNFLRHISFQAAVQQAQLQSYHVGGSIKAQAYASRPQLVALNMGD